MNRWFLHAGVAVLGVEGLVGLAYDVPDLLGPALLTLAVVAALTRARAR